ncbi:peroxisomal succinyl-coenzyme A thioesterase-like [Latimeria chalumnae]|uniref:peroxisomal succinyl-coenzyme A thioesterase-like n=1 Tax=Latimeria chalumnae TaxID=7897 RepID=UPI00313DBDEA
MEARHRNTAAPLIEVDPKRGLVDKPFELKVSFLPPNKPITLYSQLEREKNECWEAYAHYVSDSEGTVRVNQQESLGGSYSGREPMGLIWSMKPRPGSKPDLRFRKDEVTVPDLVDISVFDGHVFGDFLQKKPLAIVPVERCYMALGVKRVEIRQNGVVGTLFLPPGPGPFPAVLDLWGAIGGLYEYRAALLAANGFASLTVAYMSHKDLPGPKGVINVGPDYFEAFQILQSHPQVDADRVAIVGRCVGALIALFVTTEVPSINPKCLVSVSGFHILPLGRTQRDILGFLLSQTEKIRLDENGHMIWKYIWLPIPEDPSRKVAVGKLQCPLLLVSGEDDCSFPLVELAEDIRKMMEAAGNAHLLTSVSYPGTGHLIDPPYCPHIPFSKMDIPTKSKKVVVRWGGEPQLHARAQEDSWRKILEFLRQHLIPDQSVTLEKAKL